MSLLDDSNIELYPNGKGGFTVYRPSGCGDGFIALVIGVVLILFIAEFVRNVTSSWREYTGIDRIVAAYYNGIIEFILFLIKWPYSLMSDITSYPNLNLVLGVLFVIFIFVVVLLLIGLLFSFIGNFINMGGGAIFGIVLLGPIVIWLVTLVGNFALDWLLA